MDNSEASVAELETRLNALRRRRDALRGRSAAIATEVASIQADQARTLAEASDPNTAPIASQEKARRLEDEKGAADRAVAHLEGEIAEGERQLAALRTSERIAEARAKSDAAERAAIDARDSLLARTSHFLVREFLPLVHQVNETQRLGRAAREALQVIASAHGEQVPNWNVERYRSAHEANCLLQLQELALSIREQVDRR